MKNYRKIINYLYLGDYNSKPKFCEFSLSAANDFFDEATVKIPTLSDTSYLSKDGKQLFLNLLDYPDIGAINPDILKVGLDFINDCVTKQTDLYVHCVWGVNRSVTLVFIYLVLTKHLRQDNFLKAWKQFKKIYPRANPNPAYWHYLSYNFPFLDLAFAKISE